MVSEKATTLYSSELELYFDNVKGLVDSELQSLLPVAAQLKLGRQVEYALQSKGKRLRSILVFLCGEIVGGSRERLARLGLAVELLHLATLVHDDILDEDLFRRNTLSVYAKWSVKDAILVGDLLASISLSLCKSYRREILHSLIDACIKLSDGEYSDVEVAASDLNEKEYFEKVEKKCASLFGAACECGALAGNGSQAETNALKFFGENYGVAYQVRDDLSDAEAAGNDLQPDADKFRITLPIINAFENSSEQQQARLRRLLSEKTQHSLTTFLCEVQGYFQNGSLDYCAKKVDEYVDNAVASLTQLKEGIFKYYLVEMAESLRVSRPRITTQNVAYQP